LGERRAVEPFRLVDRLDDSFDFGHELLPKTVVRAESFDELLRQVSDARRATLIEEVVDPTTR
jgi:hypothetical protein